MKPLRIFAISAVVFSAFCSCEHKELCYDHNHVTDVRIVFEWDKSPDVLSDSLVKGMCVWFYSTDGSRPPLRYDIRGLSGDTVRIPSGTYDILCYNNDYERVLFRGTEDYLSHECLTRSAIVAGPLPDNILYSDLPRAPGTEGELWIDIPDMMWSGHLDKAEIPYSDIYSDSTITLVFHPVLMTATYTYEIRNATNLSHVSYITTALSGLAESVFCRDILPGGDTCTLSMSAFSDSVSVITGGCLTFGHHGTAGEVPHILTVYVWLKDGNKWYYDINVTKQVDHAPDPMRVHIVIDGLDIPESVPGGGGLIPDVDDWLTDEIVIPM